MDTVTVEKVTIDVPYLTPSDNVDFYFMDALDSTDSLGTKWTRSQAKKDGAEDDIAKYDGAWTVEPLAKDALSGDSGLVMKSKAKHRSVHLTLLADHLSAKEYFQRCGGQAEETLHLPGGEAAGPSVRGGFPERARRR